MIEVLEMVMTTFLTLICSDTTIFKVMLIKNSREIKIIPLKLPVVNPNQVMNHQRILQNREDINKNVLSEYGVDKGVDKFLGKFI